MPQQALVTAYDSQGQVVKQWPVVIKDGAHRYDLTAECDDTHHVDIARMALTTPEGEAIASYSSSHTRTIATWWW